MSSDDGWEKVKVRAFAHLETRTVNTLYIAIQALADDAAVERAGLAPLATAQTLRDPAVDDLEWPLLMPAVVSLLSVRPDEQDGFRFSLQSLTRAELSEADLLIALEPWLREAGEIVSVGGGDVGPALLAMAVARSGVFCPHVAALAAPPAHRGDEHILLIDEVTAGGAPRWVDFDELCAGLFIPSAGASSASSTHTSSHQLWSARRRHGEIQAVAMWLARVAWRAARVGTPEALPDAIAALETSIFYDSGCLQHLQRFTASDLPFVGSAPLAPVF